MTTQRAHADRLPGCGYAAGMSAHMAMLQHFPACGQSAENKEASAAPRGVFDPESLSANILPENT